MKRKAIHENRLRIQRDHADVMAAWRMGLVINVSDKYGPQEFFIDDCRVTEIMLDILKYFVYFHPDET